jgi:hypothetical protein
MTLAFGFQLLPRTEGFYCVMPLNAFLSVRCTEAGIKFPLPNFSLISYNLELRNKLVKCYIWNIALYGAETWTLRTVDQKHMESFEMRLDRSSVRSEVVLLRVKEQRNILHEVSKRKANWIGQIFRRNCLLQQVIEGKIKGGIEVTGRREIRRRVLLDDLKGRRGYSYLKEEALDRTMCRARFGRGFGPRQTAE